MLFFTIVNLVGVKAMAETNGPVVIWKTAIPLLTVVVLMLTSFHLSNFTSAGGFMPYGAHGVFAALPAGVVFALQGFEQAIQLAGEAKRPQRDVSRAVIAATAIGTLVYLLLEIAFIGALNPGNLIGGWANPVGKGDFGPYATLAIAAGASWLAPCCTSTRWSRPPAPAWSTSRRPRGCPTPWDVRASCHASWPG